MSNMRMKHKLIMSMMAGMIIIPGSVVRTQAAETDDSEKSLVPVTGIENILEASYQTEIKNNINLYLVPTEEGEYLNIAFSNTGDYTYIRSEADENSEWVGKLYSDSAAVVLEYLDGWTKIRSGNAEGYVPTETLFTGEEARSRSDEYTNENVTVTADCLNVREGHGTDTTVLTQINQGYAILVREEFSCLEFIMNRDTINWILKKLNTGGRTWSIYQRKSIKTASATRWWETTTFPI